MCFIVYLRSLLLLRRTGGAGDAKTEKPWNCSPLKDSETSSEFPPSFDGESPSLNRCGPNFLTRFWSGTFGTRPARGVNGGSNSFLSNFAKSKGSKKRRFANCAADRKRRDALLCNNFSTADLNFSSSPVN